jgi:hypothetical protein
VNSAASTPVVAARAEYPPAVASTPDAAPPEAAAAPMLTSPQPSRRGRSDSGTSAVSSTLPDTSARFQPAPSSTSPAASRTGVAAAAARPQARASVAPDSRATRAAPMRSVSQPLIGEGRNMPAMCALTTTPIKPRPAWWWCRWTGAMVMTATITRLAVPSTASPAMPFPASGRDAVLPGAGVTRSSVLTPSPAARTNAAAAKPNTANRYGPTRTGTPSSAARAPEGASRFGPATAPKVVATSTEAIARARSDSRLRSAAA